VVAAVVPAAASLLPHPMGAVVAEVVVAVAEVVVEAEVVAEGNLYFLLSRKLPDT